MVSDSDELEATAGTDGRWTVGELSLEVSNELTFDRPDLAGSQSSATASGVTREGSSPLNAR